MQIAIFGQGIVGLLTTYLLAQIPFTTVTSFDLFEKRRQLSKEFGASQALDPSVSAPHVKLPIAVFQSLEKAQTKAEADLTFEVSGSPTALCQAISVYIRICEC